MSLNLAGLDHDLLNFAANCTIVGLYFATADVGGNNSITTEFFRQALPAEYRDGFTFADIENYILPPGKSSRWIEEAERHAKGVCRHDICFWAYKVIGFRGSPDITGVGMLVSYAIQCSLFTVFSLANFIYHNARIKACPEAWWPERVTKNVIRFGGLIDPEKLRAPMKMIREAQLVFLDASILFALSVSVAAFASQKGHRTVYEVAFTCFVSGYVAVPLIPCLHDLWDSKVYRRPLRVLFTLVAFALGISSGGYMMWKNNHYRYVDTDCRIVDFSFKMIFTGSIVVGVSSARFALHFIEMPMWLEDLRAHYPRTNSVITSVLMIFSVALSGACWGLYLMFLASAWKDRTAVGKVVGRDKFEDSRLGFGQVVALWLWVPTLTEFFTLWHSGVSKGLTGRVLAGTKCVAEEDKYGEERVRRSRPRRYMTVEDGMQEMIRKGPKTYAAEEDE